jgi:hypothetical protein
MSSKIKLGQQEAALVVKIILLSTQCRILLPPRNFIWTYLLAGVVLVSWHHPGIILLQINLNLTKIMFNQWVRGSVLVSMIVTVDLNSTIKMFPMKTQMKENLLFIASLKDLYSEIILVNINPLKTWLHICNTILSITITQSNVIKRL